MKMIEESEWAEYKEVFRDKFKALLTYRNDQIDWYDYCIQIL